MASRTEDKVETRGFSDTVGIVLIALSLLVAVALFSYDRNDLSFFSSSAHEQPRNWIGTVGAYAAFGLFFVLGAAAYLLPVLLLGFGLAGFVDLLGYLRQRVGWAALLVVAGVGLLDIHSALMIRLFNLGITGDSASAGGWIGLVMNDLVFDHFGTIGASIVRARDGADMAISLEQFPTRRMDPQPMAPIQGSHGSRRGPQVR